MEQKRFKQSRGSAVCNLKISNVALQKLATVTMNSCLSHSWPYICLPLKSGGAALGVLALDGLEAVPVGRPEDEAQVLIVAVLFC